MLGLLLAGALPCPPPRMRNRGRWPGPRPGGCGSRDRSARARSATRCASTTRRSSSRALRRRRSRTRRSRSGRAPSALPARAVTAVDAEWRDGRRQRIETSDGSAYQGRLAGKVRFWLADPTERRQQWLLRLYGADGAVISATTEAQTPSWCRAGRSRTAPVDALRADVPAARPASRSARPRDRPASIGMIQGGSTFTFWHYPELQEPLGGYVRPLGHPPPPAAACAAPASSASRSCTGAGGGPPTHARRCLLGQGARARSRRSPSRRAMRPGTSSRERNRGSRRPRCRAVPPTTCSRRRCPPRTRRYDLSAAAWRRSRRSGRGSASRSAAGSGRSTTSRALTRRCDPTTS